jgi:hypothetical protein
VDNVTSADAPDLASAGRRSGWTKGALAELMPMLKPISMPMSTI